MDDIKTWCRTFVHAPIEELAGRRCRFISDHQQYNGSVECLKDAYLAYDNEEHICVYTPENDFNGGRDRVGIEFHPIELPVKILYDELCGAGLEMEAQQVRRLFVGHADRFLEKGVRYPGSELNYEQTIVAPAADILLQVYLITGEEKYLEGAKIQVEVLELFNGMQTDYHLHETAIRHWDGFWFGKRRFFGDTFPHYWSAETGNVFEMYGKIMQDETYLKRAEHSRRGVLPMIFADGSASCAYVYPYKVNGVKAAFYDPYANDQDWGLYYYLRGLGY